MTRSDLNPAEQAGALAPSMMPARAGGGTATLAQNGQLAEAPRSDLCRSLRQESPRHPDLLLPEPDTFTAGSDAMDRLMTTDDVCAVFGRTSRTTRNWVRAGHLHPVRVGRSVFFRREEVERLAGAGLPPAQGDAPQSPELG